MSKEKLTEKLDDSSKAVCARCNKVFMKNLGHVFLGGEEGLLNSLRGKEKMFCSDCESFRYNEKMKKERAEQEVERLLKKQQEDASGIRADFILEQRESLFKDFKDIINEGLGAIKLVYELGKYERSLELASELIQFTQKDQHLDLKNGVWLDEKDDEGGVFGPRAWYDVAHIYLFYYTALSAFKLENHELFFVSFQRMLNLSENLSSPNSKYILKENYFNKRFLEDHPEQKLMSATYSNQFSVTPFLADIFNLAAIFITQKWHDEEFKLFLIHEKLSDPASFPFSSLLHGSYFYQVDEQKGLVNFKKNHKDPNRAALIEDMRAEDFMQEYLFEAYAQVFPIFLNQAFQNPSDSSIRTYINIVDIKGNSLMGTYEEYLRYFRYYIRNFFVLLKLQKIALAHSELHDTNKKVLNELIPLKARVLKQEFNEFKDDAFKIIHKKIISKTFNSIGFLGLLSTGGFYFLASVFIPSYAIGVTALTIASVLLLKANNLRATYYYGSAKSNQSKLLKLEPQVTEILNNNGL